MTRLLSPFSLFLFLSLLAAAGRVSGADCERTLVEATRYESPAPIQGLAALDAQGDGRIDLIATRNDAPSLLLFTRTADGFSTPTDIPLGYVATAVHAADVDGDGRNDLVTAGTDRLATLFSNGNGTFRVVTSAITGVPFSNLVRVADVTGDGKLDVVAVLQPPPGTSIRGVVTTFAGQGNGAFVQAGTPRNLNFTVVRVAVGEVTGDAARDLILTDLTPAAFVLPGTADGSFGAPRSLVNAGGPRTVAAADFDGDGRDDIIVAGSGAAGRRVFLSSRAYENPLAHQISAVSLAHDLDGNGIADLIANNDVYRGQSDGTFTRVCRAVHTLEATAIADFNGDGILDFATPYLPTALLIHYGRGGLLFDGARGYASTLGAPATQLSIVDLNGDARADILTASQQGFTAFLSDANGVLAQSASVSAPVTSAVAADFTGDGRVDIFTSYWLLPGDGQGSFDTAAFIKAPEGLGGIRNALAGDFNGDGKMDIVALKQQLPSSTAMILLTGDGKGEFTLSEVPVTHGAADLVVADFNGDSISDVVTVGYVDPFNSSNRSQSARVMTGRREGSFSPSVEVGRGIAVSDWYASIDAADVDGDGHTDFVVPAQSQRAVLLFRGNGNATFRGPDEIPIQGSDDTFPVGLALGDFTGDGRTDLAVMNDGFFETSLLVQQSNGSFVRTAQFFGSDYRGGAAGDLNADGVADLVVVANDAINVYRSECRDSLPAKPPIVRLIVTPSLLIATLDERDARGMLTFYDGTTKLGTVAVENGLAKLATTLPAGTRRITAVYAGDGAFARGISDTITFDGKARRRTVRH